MSPRRRGRKKSGRGRGAATPQPLELWKAAPEPPPPEPVRPAGDPGAVMRSLGTPPLTGHGAQAEGALALVSHKAAATATALAKAAGLLIEDDGEAESP